MGEENERLVTRLEKEKNEKMEMGIKDWSPYILGIKGFFLQFLIMSLVLSRWIRRLQMIVYVFLSKLVHRENTFVLCGCKNYVVIQRAKQWLGFKGVKGGYFCV